MYAGRADCDASKGYYVGEVDVIYSSDTGYATVTFTLDTLDKALANAYMYDSHVYVGTEILKKTAPGTYGNVHNFDDKRTVDTFEIKLSTPVNSIYMVFHASVCDADVSNAKDILTDTW